VAEAWTAKGRTEIDVEMACPVDSGSLTPTVSSHYHRVGASSLATDSSHAAYHQAEEHWSFLDYCTVDLELEVGTEPGIAAVESKATMGEHSHSRTEFASSDWATAMMMMMMKVWPD